VKHAQATSAAWLTKTEALQQLAVSERSLDRMVTAGKVQKISRPREGRTPEPMFNRGDIERASAVDAFAMPDAGDGGKQLAPRDTLALPHPAQLRMLAELAGATLRQLAAPPQPEASATAPVWMTIPAASAHCGLSARLLRKLIGTGQLPALRDGRAWKVHRVDVDKIHAPARDRANRATPPRVAQSAKNGGPAA
jgi:excisionase family DNA binding protein